MGLFDFLSAEAGQKRRQWLEDTGEDAMYYVPPGLRDILGFAGQNMTPTGVVENSSQAFQQSAQPGLSPMQRAGYAAEGLGEVVGLMGPMVAGRMAGAVGSEAAQAVDALTGGLMRTPTAQGAGMMGRDFAASEAGSIGPRAGGIGDNGGPLIDPYASVDDAPHTLPQHKGAAQNRTTAYPRYRPKKTTDRMDRLLATIDDPDSPIQGMFDRYIEKGKTLGGEDWYNTEELRDWFVGGLGEAEGDKQWREYMNLIGTTSTGAKVPPNQRVASFYRALSPEDRVAVAQKVKDEGMAPQDAAAALGIEVPNLPDNPAYGHVKQRNQAGNVVNYMTGQWEQQPPEGLTGAALTKWLQANPKVKGFANDLLGDDTNIAADMHFMRMLGMAEGGADFLTDQLPATADSLAAINEAYGPRRMKRYTTTRMVNNKPLTTINLAKAVRDGVIKDTAPLKGIPSAWADTPKATEYAAYEDMANRVAQRYGMTPAQFQASLWMGAGDITNLADESQGTFMDLFRGTLDKRAAERGLSRKEMLKEFIENRAPLAVGPAAMLPLLQGGDDEDMQHPLLGGNT